MKYKCVIERKETIREEVEIEANNPTHAKTKINEIIH